MCIVPLAIRRMAAVGDVDEVLVGQFGAQRFQNAQATNAGVKDADGLSQMPSCPTQPAATAIPLNSPVAIRFCHSAGPVICALVPPESTATVTGMSTTSNS